MKFPILLGLVLLPLSAGQGQKNVAGGAGQLVAAFDSIQLRTHLEVLSADSLEGRAPGSRGGRKAAEYIADRFRAWGLDPAGDSGTYFHSFRFGPVTARNVAGILRGSGPDREEFVVIGAHFDALGIGPAVRGDSIYNGAEDNAGGASQLLVLAEGFVRSGVRPNRSVLFIGFDAEEPGLLGSKAFVERPTLPLQQMVAMINFDAANLHGATSDAVALGLRESTLDGSFRRAADAEGVTVPDAQPDSIEAFFLRSDQLPFARAGIPAIFVFVGWEFVGRSQEWASRLWSDYFEQHYHQPSDEMQDSFSMAGALQQVRVAGRMALEIANAPDRPRWMVSSRFFRH